MTHLTLLARLEAATSRLEDIAQATIDPKGGSISDGVSPTSGPGLVPTISAPAVKAAPVPEPLPESIEAFDAFLDGPVKKFTSIATSIGGLVAEQVR
jgi:adenylyl cyclase-associated protein